MTDYPFTEIALAVEEHAKMGHRCYQKFTCDNCGERLGIDTPNIMHTKGICEKCGHITDIVAKGCNYLLIMEIKK